MQKFNYNLDYRNIFFQPNDYRYRIGEKEQGVFLVRPYSDDIGKIWKFSTERIAEESSEKIYELYLSYKEIQDFVGMDMCRKFLEMGFTRARRYANHKDGKKYKNGKILPQEKDALTSQKAISARIFKSYRDLCTQDEYYIQLRKKWRDNELVVSRQTSQRTA